MTRLLRFYLSAGPVEVHFPSEMTPDDVQDFEDSITILLRSVRRWHAPEKLLPATPARQHDGETDTLAGPHVAETLSTTCTDDKTFNDQPVSSGESQV